jgi:uncharacterized membrane protein (DUF4010 family)
VLGWLFVGFALAVAGAYIVAQLRQGSDVSITSLVVALLTFALGPPLSKHTHNDPII